MARRASEAMEAGVRYSAAGVVAEAHLATWSHSGKLLRDLPSPKRCGTRATITGSSYDADLGPDGGRPAVWWVRIGEPSVACSPGREPNRRIASAGCTTRPCVKGSCTQPPLSASHDLQPFWAPCEVCGLGPTMTTGHSGTRPMRHASRYSSSGNF